MLNFIEEFCNRASAAAVYPFIFATIIACLVAAHGFCIKHKSSYGSVEWADASWRMMACAQGATIIWLIWIVMCGIPTPDYLVKNNTVVQRSSYWQVFSECNNGHAVDSDLGPKITPDYNTKIVEMRERRMQTCRVLAQESQKY